VTKALDVFALLIICSKTKIGVQKVTLLSLNRVEHTIDVHGEMYFDFDFVGCVEGACQFEERINYSVFEECGEFFFHFVCCMKGWVLELPFVIQVKRSHLTLWI